MKAFITCLSSNNEYLKGVLVLNESLKRTSTKYPFYCMVSADVNETTRHELEQHGVRLITKDSVPVPGKENNEMSGWDYTYFKFRLFELIEFEKIVFLDCDMIVMKNIDDLFEHDNLALCKDGYQFTGIKDNDNCGCNSGLMVIKPDAKMAQKLIAALPEAIEQGLSGDQAVLNQFLDENTEWLPEFYNMTPNMIDKACYREKYFNFKYKDLRVVHFIWKFKPFFSDRLSFSSWLSMVCRLHFFDIKVNRFYYKVMKRALS